MPAPGCATHEHHSVSYARGRACRMRSTMHYRLSRCWMWARVSAATSERRSPQPSGMASIARSRNPFFVAISGAFRSAWACLSESQFPTRTPLDLAPLTREMPAASSSDSNPLSLSKHYSDSRDSLVAHSKRMAASCQNRTGFLHRAISFGH